MDRRIALKNIGLSFGYVVVTPTVLSLLQSCKNENVITWTPEFLSKEEGAILTKLVDIILPKTDTPSASEVNVHIFIDKYAKEIMEEKDQIFFKMAMNKFTDKALSDAGKDKIEDLTTEDLEPVLASALKVSKEDEVKNFKLIDSYHQAIEAGEIGVLDDNIARFAFMNSLRGLTIWGFKTSEFIGEEVLAYLPVPGEYIGCGDLQELTGGKAWSL
jgi:hypothetical protein